jgi:hypothetical protein
MSAPGFTEGGGAGGEEEDESSDPAPAVRTVGRRIGPISSGPGTDSVVPDEEPDDEESEPEPNRTLDQLRNTGDPNAVDRTPVLGTDDIPVKPGEWPLGFPVQGIPRVAAVLNLNYVYNEEREQWERQKKGERRDPFPEVSTGPSPDSTGSPQVPSPSLTTTKL